jgi:predicted Zn-dependent peptidase
LFNNLREDKGYTYGAYSGFTALQYPGSWNAFSDVRTDVTDGSMHEFMYELNRIRDEKVSAKELEEVKRSLVANFALSLENPAALLSNAIIQKIYHLPANYWDTYTEKIAAITADDVQRVAKKYVAIDHLTIIAVGDATKIKSVMAKYGDVEVYNTDGVRVGS